jgi:hypothetical protein
MMDFKTMFPTMEYEVIECVLRSNNGAVDATIDQLLQMSIDGNCSDDSSDSEDSISPEVSGISPVFLSYCTGTVLHNYCTITAQL